MIEKVVVEPDLYGADSATGSTFAAEACIRQGASGDDRVIAIYDFHQALSPSTGWRFPTPSQTQWYLWAGFPTRRPGIFEWFGRNNREIWLQTIDPAPRISRDCVFVVSFEERPWLVEPRREREEALHKITAAVERERTSFIKQRSRLMGDATLRNKYVCVMDGKVVDSDYDDEALVARIYSRVGFKPMYIGYLGEKARESLVTTPF